MANNTYIDSSILVEAINSKNEAKNEAKDFLYRLARKHQNIQIPQLVLGETFLQIYEKYHSDNRELENRMGKFTKTLQDLIDDSKGHTPALTGEILRLALEIKGEETGPKPDFSDCVIVSHALVDRESLYLYIIDAAVHDSTIIAQKIKEYGKRNGHYLKLKI
jgi:predicted nucleic acid-binding protein